MLKEVQPGKEEREEHMKRVGYPAYTTQAGNHNIICNWPLVPKFAGSNPAKAVGFFRVKKSPARLPSEGK
jgi:hypothetical protein